MMQSWFTCKVKYSKPDSDGQEQKVTEAYLVNAFSYTEAEGRMYQIVRDELGVGGEVSQITKSAYAEVFRFDDAELWFRCKVALISFDEESGKEKQSNQHFLVQASDVRDAYDKLHQEMSKSTTDFLIPGITYTKILDVYDWSGDAAERMRLEQSGFTSIGSSLKANEDFEED